MLFLFLTIIHKSIEVFPKLSLKDVFLVSINGIGWEALDSYCKVVHFNGGILESFYVIVLCSFEKLDV